LAKRAVWPYIHIATKTRTYRVDTGSPSLNDKLPDYQTKQQHVW